jgi:hypothetical protein
VRRERERERERKGERERERGREVPETLMNISQKH